MNSLVKRNFFYSLKDQKSNTYYAGSFSNHSRIKHDTFALNLWTVYSGSEKRVHKVRSHIKCESLNRV